MPDAQVSFTEDIPESIRKDLDKAKAIDAIFCFKVSGDNGGTWTVNMKDEPGVTEGDTGAAECTIELSSEDWLAMTAKLSAPRCSSYDVFSDARILPPSANSCVMMCGRLIPESSV